jgi:pimeloyl-ACP methyl ester carboxylesterase
VPFFEYGDVQIRYEETGAGFPLLVIPGGGLNAGISFFRAAPFDVMEEFKGRYRIITLDLRNAVGGESFGPLEVDRPWDSHTDDQLALMDHLGVDKFMVMGFCIGGPMIWNLLQRAGDRVVAAVLAQPSGFRPELPDLFYENNISHWGPDLCAARPEITLTMVDAFLTKMYRSNPDFVFTVTRDFVRSCATPILVLPDDVSAHPYAVAMESALLAPNAEASLYPWKEPRDRTPLAVRHIRTFLHANDPTVSPR